MSQAALDSDFKRFLDAAAARGLSGLGTLPVAEERVSFSRDWVVHAGAGPQTVAVRELTLGDKALKARLYEPAGCPVISAGMVYFHGGGLVLGTLDDYDPLCRWLAEYSGARILSVAYRLAPEHSIAAPHHDAHSAALWAFEHAQAIGFDSRRIALGGDSAGANLAAVTALMLRDSGAPIPAFQLLIYPGLAADETESMRSHGEGLFLTRSSINYFMGQFRLDAGEAPPVSPLQSSLQGLPPALVVTAGYDPMRDSGRSYAEKLNQAGVEATLCEFPAFIHGFCNMTAVSAAVLPAIARIAQGLHRGLNHLEQVK